MPGCQLLQTLLQTKCIIFCGKLRLPFVQQLSQAFEVISQGHHHKIHRKTFLESNQDHPYIHIVIQVSQGFL